MSVNKVYQYSEEEFIELINTSKTFFEISQKMGYSPNGRHSYDLIRQRCNELELDTSHLGNRAGGNNGVSVVNLDDVLIENSPYVLFVEILVFGIIKNQCYNQTI